MSRSGCVGSLGGFKKSRRKNEQLDHAYLERVVKKKNTKNARTRSERVCVVKRECEKEKEREREDGVHAGARLTAFKICLLLSTKTETRLGLADLSTRGPSVGVFGKQIFKRPFQFLAINANKMAARTNQWFQERTWNAPTKGLAWVDMLGFRFKPVNVGAEKSPHQIVALWCTPRPWRSATMSASPSPPCRPHMVTKSVCPHGPSQSWGSVCPPQVQGCLAHQKPAPRRTLQ